LNGEHVLTGDKHTRASKGLAQAAMDAGQTPVAISVLETLRQGSGGSLESLLLLSKAYRKAGLADEALAPAMEAVERDPTNADARSEAVAASMEAEAWGAALTQINRWTDASPDDPTVWIQKAQLHHQLTQTDDARAALAQALRLSGTDPLTVGPISQLLTRLGKPQLAVRLLKRAASAEPEDETIMKSLAETAERTEDFDTALDAWTSLAERSPEDQIALRHVGESLWRLHRRSAAIGYWQRGLTQDPKNIGLAIRLAHAHLENGEPDRGLEHLRHALSLCPDDPKLAVEAAAAFRRHGTPEEALEILQTASALVPGNHTIREAIADAFTEMGSHEEARQMLSDLTDRDSPASATVLAKLSLAEMALGNPVASFEAFGRIDPTQLGSAQDALWTAQAGFNHAAWPKVLAAVESAIEGVENDPALLVNAIELRARLADATWLYEQGAKAKAHSPQAPMVAPETASAWIEKSRRMGVDEATCQRLDQQLALVASRINADRIDTDTASPAMIESLVIAHLREGEAEAVIAILAENPGARQNEWAPLLAGLAHLHRERHTQARKAFGAVPAVPAVKPLAAYFTAQALLQQSQMAEAIDALNAALAAWPNEATWHHKLAQAYAATGEVDMALPHYQQASELEPDDGNYCLSLAKHLQAMGVHHQAEEHFVHALQHFPEDSEVWRQAGYAALAIGASDEALTRFRRASELAPEDFDARIGAARAAQAGGQIATALQWASQAVDLAPENSRALMGWADILTAQGKHDKALSAYQRAEAGMADPSQAQNARGRLFMQTGRPEAAVLELMKVVENRPDDEAAWSGLAQAYEQSGEIKEAAAAVKKALAIAPAAVTHRLSLARLSRKSGQLDHALAELSTLQVEQPNSAEVAYELARVHEARRDFEKAMDGYRRTISLDKGHARAHYRAGLVLKALKDYDEAAVMFKSAVDLSPHDADAHHQLAAVRALELVHGGIQQTPAVAQ
jgi:tetratricopeptide (TPR) repeat protein